jgi:acyl-coenzyme A synthetase/AMP-(fatty) acid ligase
MSEAPLIFRGGRPVPPHEVEQALLSHPAVAEAAVVGIPDHRLGEIVGAAVRLATPLPSAAKVLAAHCRALIPAYQVPERWLLVSDLPRTTDGKVCLVTVTARLAITIAPQYTPLSLVQPRLALEDIRIPRQVRRSSTLEDL